MYILYTIHTRQHHVNGNFKKLAPKTPAEKKLQLTAPFLFMQCTLLHLDVFTPENEIKTVSFHDGFGWLETLR